MYMRIIFVAVLSFFCYCKGELHSFSIKYKTRITSNETVITTAAVPSSVACARECTRDDCCTACYNKTTNTCHLHRDCFPVIEHSDSGVLLRKNDVILSNQDTTVQTGIKTTSDKTTKDKTTPNITYYTMATDKTSYQPSSGITTDYMKITDTKARTAAKISNLTIYETTNLTSTTVNTGIKTTSDNLTSDKTTTTDMMYYKTTTNKTSYQTNNTTTYIKITDTKASTAAKTTDLTTYETTKLKTTTVKATPVQTTNDILDCTGVVSGSTSGVYTIYIENQPVDVYCEMTGGEQWTVIQKRLDGTTDFYRNWQEYKDGFGDVNLEYWLGNENLHKILSTKSYKLRIDLEDWNGDTRYAEYDTFVVGSENTNYMLAISGYSGDAGDSLINPTRGSNYQINGMAFSTFDSDNDQHDYIHIATYLHSGWWLKWSTDANLNGKFYATEQSQSNAIYWQSWRATEIPLKSVSMKIKPN